MDFNTLHPTDPNYRNVPIVIDPLSLFKQEILMLLETKPEDILGSYDNYIDVESLVFKTKINEDELYSKIRNGIESMSAYASDFTWECRVFFVQSDDMRSEIGVIQIEIYDMINPEKLASTLEFLYQK